MQDRLWDRDRDYDTLVTWWTQWEFGVVPKECLPPDGIMVEIDGKPVCAGGLYIGEGTKFAFMEWIVTDKDANPRDTHKCLKKCIDSIMNMAKSKGMKLVYTATKTSITQKVHKIPRYGANGEQREDLPAGPGWVVFQGFDLDIRR